MDVYLTIRIFMDYFEIIRMRKRCSIQTVESAQNINYGKGGPRSNSTSCPLEGAGTPPKGGEFRFSPIKSIAMQIATYSRDSFPVPLHTRGLFPPPVSPVLYLLFHVGASGCSLRHTVCGPLPRGSVSRAQRPPAPLGLGCLIPRSAEKQTRWHFAEFKARRCVDVDPTVLPPQGQVDRASPKALCTRSESFHVEMES